MNLKFPQEGQLVIKKTKTVSLPVKLTYAQRKAVSEIVPALEKW